MSSHTEAALDLVQGIVDRVIRQEAAQHDREGSFPRNGVSALGQAGLLGLVLPAELGGLGAGPREFADVTETIAEADASLAMIYVMHICGIQCILRSGPGERLQSVLRQVGQGTHLTTLAFSEKGSRSHFWSPVSQARPNAHGVYISAEKSWVTSAGEADSYIVISQAPGAASPAESTLYFVENGHEGIQVKGRWDGIGLRGNASAPVSLDSVEVPPEFRLTPDGKALEVLLSVVLPWFNLGVGALSLGICRAATKGTIDHLQTSRLEHLGQNLAEAYPTLRARLGRMQQATDALAGLIDVAVRRLESPDERTAIAVLEVKAAGNETAIQVTADAMRACGGAAFSRHTSIDRHFRDAQAGAVMAPTVDQLHEFLGRTLVGLPPFG